MGLVVDLGVDTMEIMDDADVIIFFRETKFGRSPFGVGGGVEYLKLNEAVNFFAKFCIVGLWDVGWAGVCRLGALFQVDVDGFVLPLVWVGLKNIFEFEKDFLEFRSFFQIKVSLAVSHVDEF